MEKKIKKFYIVSAYLTSDEYKKFESIKKAYFSKYPFVNTSCVIRQMISIESFRISRLKESDVKFKEN